MARESDSEWNPGHPVPLLNAAGHGSAMTLFLKFQLAGGGCELSGLNSVIVAVEADSRLIDNTVD